MKNRHDTKIERRRFLKLLGGGAVLIPAIKLSGCAGEQEPPAAGPAPKPTQPEPAPPKPEASPPPAEAVADLPNLPPDNPQAQALGYVENASQADAAKFPQYKAGQFCRGCALYTGAADAAYGPCGIFPGYSVNTGGWCSAFVPKPPV